MESVPNRALFPLGLKRGSWSLGLDDFEAIFSRLKKIKGPITLVELGAGISSIIFGLFLRRLNLKNTIFSFEGDKDWVERVQRMIARYNLEKTVNLLHVPYAKDANAVWFDKVKITEAIKGRRIDALLVDAPPANLCPLSRKGAIPFFLACMNEESVVFLHDASRKDEEEIADGWSRYFRKSKKIDTAAGIVLMEGVEHARKEI